MSWKFFLIRQRQIKNARVYTHTSIYFHIMRKKIYSQRGKKKEKIKSSAREANSTLDLAKQHPRRCENTCYLPTTRAQSPSINKSPKSLHSPVSPGSSNAIIHWRYSRANVYAGNSKCVTLSLCPLTLFFSKNSIKFFAKGKKNCFLRQNWSIQKNSGETIIFNSKSSRFHTKHTRKKKKSLNIPAPQRSHSKVKDNCWLGIVYNRPLDLLRRFSSFFFSDNGQLSNFFFPSPELRLPHKKKHLDDRNFLMQYLCFFFDPALESALIFRKKVFFKPWPRPPMINVEHYPG